MIRKETRKETVLRALRHEQTAPIPYQCDMTERVLRMMIEHTGNPDFMEHTGSYLAEDRNLFFTDLGNGFTRDQFGVVWDRSAQDGDFGIVRHFPLPEPTFGAYTFPEPDDSGLRAKCEALTRQNDRFTLFNVSFSLFERAWTLHGMPNVLCDMLLEKEFLGELLDRIVDYNLRVIDIVCQYPIDCILFGDDWGQQHGLIMGYPHWLEFIKPRLKRMYDHVKQKGRFVAQHACGDCREVLPDLVELGLDIYNTFQPEVYDIAECKRLYGDRLTFYGGISTQRLLPCASPAEVKSEMHRIMNILAKGGGYIIAPTHAMTSDTPPENVLAFLEVCQQENPA